MRQLIVAVLVLAACSAESGDVADSTSSTTATDPVTTASTTTTTTPSTTTTQAPQPFIGNNTRFQPGTTYRGTLAVVDLEFELEFRSDGWRVIERGIGEGRFVRFANTSATPGTDVLLMAWMANSSTDEITAWFLDHPDLAEATDVEETLVRGFAANVVDIRLVLNAGGGCGFQMPTVADATTGSGGPGGAMAQSIWACTWGRTWAIDVDGITITVVGTADDDSVNENREPWQIEDFEHLLDDFINAITFCTEATPCDD